MRTIPITYIKKTQNLYVEIFEIEDGPIYQDEVQSLSAMKRAYNEYLEKMFLGDAKASAAYDYKLNQSMTPGTFKEICDFVRSMGYEVLSRDNSTKKQIIRCEKKCLEEWREWRKTKKIKIT